MKVKDNNTQESFEELLKKLENSVESLQNENISLDAALINFEEGMKSYNDCLEILNNAKQKILLFDTNSKSFKEIE